MDEWIEIEYLYGDTDGNHAGPWASYGGPASTNDMPTHCVLRYYEQAREGTAYTIVANMGALGSVSTSTTITSAISTAMRLNDLHYNMILAGDMTTANGGGNLSATHVWQGTSYGVGWSNSDGTVSHSTGAGIIIGHSAGATSTLGYSQSPFKEAVLLGYVDAIDGAAYPDPTMQIMTQRIRSIGPQEITATAGSWADAIIQKRYSVASSRFSTLGFALDDYTPDHHQWIMPNILAAHKESGNDWRILHRGPWYKAFTMRQANDFLLFNGSPVGGWSALNADLQQDGSEIKIAVYGDPSKEGSALWLPPAAIANWQNARFLTIAVRCDQEHDTPFRIRIGHKEWSQDAAGVPLAASQGGATFTIDLCVPTNANATVDDKESRYPSPTIPSDFWGVTQVREFYNDTTPGGFQVTRLAAGAVFWVGQIHLVIMDKATATFASPLSQTFQRRQQSAGEFALRLLTSNVDGREPSIDEHCYLTDDGSGSAQYTTIQQLVTALQANDDDDGWSHAAAKKYLNLTVTPEVIDSVADPVFNLDRPAAWCMGNGLRITKEGGETNATPKRSWDKDFLTGNLVVQAQVLADFVVFYPGCGDCMRFTDTTAYGDPIQLRAGKIMRSEAAGGIVTDQWVSAPDGTVVRCHEMPADTEAGTTSVAGGRGNYKTVAPFVRSGSGIGGKAYTNETDAFFVPTPRMRRRRWMRAGLTFHGPWNLETADGEYMRVAGTDGAIYAWSTHWSIPKPHWVVTEQLVTEGRNARIAEDHRGFIYLVYERPTREGYQPWQAMTADKGRTWFDYRKIFEQGSWPTIAIGQDVRNTQVVACVYQGRIYGSVRHTGDVEFSPPFVFKDQAGRALNVRDHPFHIQETSDGVQRWLLVVAADGPGGEDAAAELSEWYSTDFCRTWRKSADLFRDIRVSLKWPTICHGQLSRATMIAAYGSGPSAYDAHRIYGCIRHPGDVEYSPTFIFEGAAYGVRFYWDAFDDGVFHIQQAADPQARWVLTAATNETAQDYFSVDDGRTWVSPNVIPSDQ